MRALELECRVAIVIEVASGSEHIEGVATLARPFVPARCELGPVRTLVAFGAPPARVLEQE